MYSGIKRFVRYERPVFSLTMMFKNIPERGYEADFENMHAMYSDGRMLLVLTDADYLPACRMKRYLQIDAQELLVFDCTADVDKMLSPAYKNWSEPMSAANFKFTANVIDDPFTLLNNFMNIFILEAAGFEMLNDYVDDFTLRERA